MTEHTPQGDPAPGEPTGTPAGTSPEPAAGESLTEGGYAYSVADDDPQALPRTAGTTDAPRERRRGVSPLLLAALAIVPAIIVGVLVWFAVSWFTDDSGGGDRVNADVSNVITAFSQGDAATTVRRYEGELPPGYPDDVPMYPGSDLVASLVQLSGENAAYLVVYDTSDSRGDVAAFFEDALGERPWQVEAGRDGADASLQQFTKTDSADITGVVLSAESKDDDVTTIVISMNVISGADEADDGQDFEPAVGKTLPSGFPDDVAIYPDAILIETVYQRQPEGDSYLASFLTRESTSDVVQFYRDEFEDNGWTVNDGDATEAPLENADAVGFSDDGGEISGGVLVGDFADDGDYTQINLQIVSTR